MEPRNRTTYSELLEIIVCRQTQSQINTPEFINLLEQVVKHIGQFQHAKYLTALTIFKSYLKKFNLLLVDEKFICSFREWSLKESFHGTETKNAGANIVHLVNKAGEGSKWLVKPILNGIGYRRMKNFKFLSEGSQRAFAFFEQNAKQVKTNRLPVREQDGRISVYKEFQLLKKPLALIPRYNRLDRCLQFMRKIHIRDLQDITEEDFLKEKDSDPRCLKELSPLFANLHNAGYLKTNPFCKIDFNQPAKPKVIEFITKESIETLLAYSSQPSKFDEETIRNLLLCTIAYDSSMRIGELLSLKVGDFSKEDGVDVLRIRSDIQKGQNKNEKYLVFMFKSTSIVLNYYLKFVRAKFNPKSEKLFIGRNGKPISYSAARKHVINIQKLLSMELYHDKNAVITPHHFRRTFGTLNAPGIGLDLSLDELASRLRHEDPKTTRDRYISQNVYLEKIRLKESIIKKKASETEKYSQEDVSDFLEWLRFYKKVPNELISEIRERLKHMDAIESVNKVTNSLNFDFTLSEQDAMIDLKPFKITVAGLREFALKNHKCTQIKEVYIYDEGFVNSLTKDYVLLKTALKELNISKQTVINNSELFSRTVIGRVTLVKKSSISYYIENGGRWGNN